MDVVNQERIYRIIRLNTCLILAITSERQLKIYHHNDFDAPLIIYNFPDQDIEPKEAIRINHDDFVIWARNKNRLYFFRLIHNTNIVRIILERSINLYREYQNFWKHNNNSIAGLYFYGQARCWNLYQCNQEVGQ
ncbi:hypothetical protein TTHERM_001005249 (macronuclear) [Tetrahymena thermophila SB210]|uniref:Uncharacterized protein n=1 Tax=Tetrahymena thermophila (strain SB210) TaxID=312017 RepID=W7XL84_TETTS|nr:hypothetical protein TTHERM_001005249 [Tetrahymena thermophila SB210]EWS75844.1 hypothetical protein TTHERM_001005249 [Tetrahymena thermophila SB210]|eukprot:XP_012651627.1 hypothetical protein TTHERM_001005249 [Tetrahymena thermophila SB210]